MKEKIENIYQVLPFFGSRPNFSLRGVFFLIMFCCSLALYSQSTKTVTGFVLDESHNPIPGATVVAKDNTAYGNITDSDGRFFLEMPTNENYIVVSFIGMKRQEIDVSNKESVTIILKSESVQLDDVVVVGYGQQKKESVVGAITQTKGDILEKTGGVSSVGATLTGNLPGVITVATEGTPGEEDPKIYIRGQSTWNNSDPLILVDGIERSMSSVDVSSIESISVLKDASATAVFGVKGANGVILITTKRGKEGKAVIRIKANATMKIPSLLAGKYDSYDALRIRNEAIVRELGLYPSSWDEYMPYGELDKYRNPSTPEEADRYANVDWADVLVKDFAMAYNANVSASGGSLFVKYFTSIDYQYEGDIMNKLENWKTYDPGYGYNRLNVRSNLDFDLTKTTVLTANLSGSYGVKQDTYNQDAWEYRIWQSIYDAPPDAYWPQYEEDHSWGWYQPDDVSALNSALTMANNGIRKITTTRINTDFTLKQDLGMILKGLSAKGTLSFDNTFKTVGGIKDDGSVLQKYINPITGEITYDKYLGNNKFNWIPSRWTAEADETYTNVWGGSDDFRKLYYQLQLDYAKKFGNHDVGVMGLFSRDKYATGSEFEHFREDWVFRTTYNYASKYFFEFNGAYNGSEKFGPDNRFAFFPSGALGWMISEEGFMQGLDFLDMLKLRGSYGEVGDDNVSERWLYMTQWSYGSNAPLGAASWDTSPYTWWKESKIGNEDIHWEKVTKINVGVDFAFLHGLFAGSVDVFNDHRTDILLAGADRSIPAYFGGTPAMANLGEVRVKGYELQLRVNKVLSKNTRLWGNFSMSHAKDEILDADDPELLDSYKKKEGKQIGQTYSHISDGYYNTWDEVYGSTVLETYDQEKLPGNLYIMDYNGDGVIDSYDSVPYAYPDRPQNTYSGTVGIDWKGFSAYVQFYGVNNSTRSVSLQSFSKHLNRVYEQGSFWSEDNTDADVPMPRWNSHMNYSGTTYLYDSSYIRLKNMEIAYTFQEHWLDRIGISALRVYLSGNNLWMWTNMPDDREVNMGSGSAYPTVRRINLGLNITL
jgi:TonB-linked SusC/RagA family outer membrane protein